VALDHGWRRAVARTDSGFAKRERRSSLAFAIADLGEAIRLQPKFSGALGNCGDERSQDRSRQPPIRSNPNGFRRIMIQRNGKFWSIRNPMKAHPTPYSAVALPLT
jgi:hypothetical protein